MKCCCMWKQNDTTLPVHTRIYLFVVFRLHKYLWRISCMHYYNVARLNNIYINPVTLANKFAYFVYGTNNFYLYYLVFFFHILTKKISKYSIIYLSINLCILHTHWIVGWSPVKLLCYSCLMFIYFPNGTSFSMQISLCTMPSKFISDNKSIVEEIYHLHMSKRARIHRTKTSKCLTVWLLNNWK